MTTTTISPTAAIGTDMNAGHAHRAERHVDGGKLGDQGQEVDDLELAQREAPPALAKPLVDHGGVAAAGSDAQAHNHLLDEVGDRQQQGENPQQLGAVVGTCLGIGGDGAGIVVGHHDDQPGAKDHQERQQPRLPARTHDAGARRQDRR